MSHAAKSWFILTLLTLSLIVIGHLILGREGLLIGLSIGLWINFYVYFYESSRIVKKFNGSQLEGQDAWGILAITKRLSARMRVPLPQVIVVDHNTPQILVVGRSLTQGSIILTSGLLKKLTPEEHEALIAFSLASILNLNTVTFSIASFITNVILHITGFLDSILRLLLVEKKDSKQPLSEFFTRLIAPFIGFILRLSIRPNAYFKADGLASRNLENPEHLARALWKLTSYSYTLPLKSNLDIAHMYAVNPLTQEPWARYLHTQPDLSKRIRRLVGYYPL
jgi:heat shock protein HtpX